jgi:putative heme-binding domain-containing protein
LSGEKICDVSLGVPTSEAAEFLLANRPGALHHIARYIKPELLPKVFERIDSIAALRQVNQAMVERAVKLPDSFTARGVEMARQALAGEDTKVIEEGIRLIVEMKLPGLDEELGKIARGRPRTGRLRAPAIEALRSVPILSSLAADSEFLMSLRQKAVTSLGAVNTAESRQELVKLLKDAPDKLAATIAQALTVSKEGGDLLLKTIESGKASRRLLADRSVQGRLQAFGFELKDVPEANAAVDKLIETRRKAYLGFDPDVARGQKQFEKTCAVCHQIGGKGAKVGPSLDGIGHRGLERVLEDVLDPSRAVDQAFRSTIVRTKSGQVYSGLIVREDGEALVIVESGEEVRVPLADVEKRTVSSLSPMPPNLADTMSEEDFLHLIGYLLSQK